MNPGVERTPVALTGARRSRLVAGLQVAFAGAALAALSLFALWLALRVSGFDASRALLALWTGSVGSAFALTSATLVRSTPLILTGVAVTLAFRAGVWNIGADGQLLAGAAAATAIALGWGGPLGHAVLPLALIGGMLGGALWAGIAAMLRARFGVLEVISTIMLNFVAADLVGYLVRGPLQEPTHAYPQSDPVPPGAHLPALLPHTRLHWGIVIAIGCAGVLWWGLRSTAAGFRVRAVGQNPDAARSAGEIDVERTASHVLVVSGALAGLAGAIEVTGVTYALYENLSPGYGYTAIAVALLAGLDPLGVVVTGVLFGALESGALAMQRQANVPAVVVSVVEAALVLIVLAAIRWRGRSRSALARFAGVGAAGVGDAP